MSISEIKWDIISYTPGLDFLQVYNSLWCVCVYKLGDLCVLIYGKKCNLYYVLSVSHNRVVNHKPELYFVDPWYVAQPSPTCRHSLFAAIIVEAIIRYGSSSGFIKG